MSAVNIVMYIFPDFSLYIKTFLIQKWDNIVNTVLSLFHTFFYIFFNGYAAFHWMAAP